MNVKLLVLENTEECSNNGKTLTISYDFDTYKTRIEIGGTTRNFDGFSIVLITLYHFYEKLIYVNPDYFDKLKTADAKSAKIQNGVNTEEFKDDQEYFYDVKDFTDKTFLTCRKCLMQPLLLVENDKLGVLGVCPACGGVLSDTFLANTAFLKCITSTNFQFK